MTAALLSADAVHDLLIELHDWETDDEGEALHTVYKFKDFAKALAFVNQVGALAEAANHHPDFSLGWGYVGITLSTHDAGGLTAKDATLARQIVGLKK